MRLYVDGMFFRSTGVGRVYENLVDALLAQPWVEGLETVVPESERRFFLERFTDDRLSARFAPFGPMTLSDLTKKARLVREASSNVALSFYPSHNVPLGAPRPYVLTVNDTTAFSPLFRVPWHRRWRRPAFAWLLERSIRAAARVVTISQTAREDVSRLFPAASDKIEVVYPWVARPFFEPLAPADVTGPHAGTPEGDYVLYLGLRIHHKNLDGLLAAFEILAASFPELHLVVAGRRYQCPDMVDAWKARSPLGARVVEFVDPTDDQVRRLLSRARAFVFPSLAEGFGLPPLEAMAAGVPVVCSSLPVFREVYGDAVVYADPSNPAEIAAGVRRVLEEPSARETLVAAGRARASRYTQAATEAGLLGIIRETAGR